MNYDHIFNLKHKQISSEDYAYQEIILNIYHKYKPYAKNGRLASDFGRDESFSLSYEAFAYFEKDGHYLTMKGFYYKADMLHRNASRKYINDMKLDRVRRMGMKAHKITVDQHNKGKVSDMDIIEVNDIVQVLRDIGEHKYGQLIEMLLIEKADTQDACLTIGWTKDNYKRNFNKMLDYLEAKKNLFGKTARTLSPCRS